MRTRERAVGEPRINASVATLLCTVLCVLPAMTSSAAVGRTAGIASVSQIGTAQYSIPLSLPPGVNGLTPSLALSYSSQQSNGFLGVGWSVTGLSAITRCVQTFVQNGAPTPVMLSASDRFCLDGNQLRRVSGAYGAAGSVYQTELETFSRVTAYGTAGAGPAYFIVESKGGLKYEYGNTADSRVEPSPIVATPKLWALSRIRDRAGNSVQFSYTEDTSAGVFRISSITYTHSDSGAGPHYRIDFITEARPDIINAYDAGQPILENRRLDRIDVYPGSSGGNLIRRYDLTYGAAGTTGRSRLASVQECAGSECLQPTTFAYENGTAGWSSETSGGETVSYMASALPIDINGDGRDDLVYHKDSTNSLWVKFGTTTGYQVGQDTGGFSANLASALPLDFNVDGKMDILIPGVNGNWRILISNGATFSPIETTIPATGAGGNAWVGDINGDARPDLIYVTGVESYAHTTVYVRYNTGTGFSPTATAAYSLGQYEQFSGGAGAFGSAQNIFRSQVRTGDFDGDGRIDLIVGMRWDRNEGDPPGPDWRYRWRVLLGRGSSFVLAGQTALDVTWNSIVTDVNGDGFSDLLVPHADLWKMMYGRDTGLSMTMTSSGVPAGVYAKAKSADWDGDGLADLVTSVNGTYYYSRSTGTGFEPAISLGIPDSAATAESKIADVNGDGLADWVYVNASQALRLRLHAGVKPDLLTSATDGFSIRASFAYAPISGRDACYSRDAPAPQFPAFAFASPLYTTCTMTASDGRGGNYTVQYKYFNASFHSQGRGFLGFARKEMEDSRDEVLHVEEYRQDFPYIGSRVYYAARQPSGSLIKEVRATPATHPYGSGYETRQFAYASEIVTTDYEVDGPYNGQLLRTTTRSNTADAASGTIRDTSTTVVEAAASNGGLFGGESHTSRTYHAGLFNDVTGWCLGRPSTTQHTNSHTMLGGAAITRTSTTDWDGVHCRPERSTIEPGDIRWQVTTDYGYDGFGNNDATTVTPAAGQGQAIRHTSIGWGSDGRAPRSFTNPEGHTTSFVWDFDQPTAWCPAASTSIGALRCVMDANALAMRLDVDPFGRPLREQFADGVATTYELAACNASNSFCGSPDLRVSVQATQRDNSNNAVRTDTQYLDGFGRLRYSYNQMLGGGNSGVITTYDNLGRVAQRSTPFTAGDPIWYTSYTYDLVGRPTLISRPTSEGDTSSHDTQINYQGFTIVQTDALNRSTTRRLNAAGQTVQMVDVAGADIDYEYDAFGNLRKVRHFNGAEVSLTYNVRGMKMTLSDPYTGNWSYDYFPLGELRDQWNARNQRTRMTYDRLSRPLKRIEPEGDTDWVWDTRPKGIGQLASVSSPGGYSEAYYYDTFGRPSRTDICADLITYTYEQTYNTAGLLETLTYPTSTSGVRFKLRYGYEYGLMRSVQDFTGNVAGTVYWQANATNARGQVIHEQYGNGLQTISGYDRIAGWLDDRTTGPAGSSSIQNLAYSWYRSGILRQREDLNQGLAETFYYDGLDRLDYSLLNGIENLNLGYDSMGHVESKASDEPPPAYSKDTSWYSYNLPYEISTAAASSRFFYGPDRARWKQVSSRVGDSETLTYVGGLMEKRVAGSTTEYRHYIYGGNGPAAIYKRSGTGTNTTYYLATDHLGSTDAITNGAGALLLRTSFGAFGNRRGANWAGIPSPAERTQIENITHRGFTFHEHLDDLGVIHMNGRVHDPASARFTSADPFVQAPHFSQSLNRYAYTFNSPLSYTDPSGFSADDEHLNKKEHCIEGCGGSSWGAYGGASLSSGRSSTQQPAMVRDMLAEHASNERNAAERERNPGVVGEAVSTDDGNGLWSAWSRASRAFGNGVAEFSMRAVQPAIDMAYSIENVAHGRGTRRDAVNIGAGYVLAGLSATPVGYADDAARAVYVWKGAGPISGTFGVNPVTRSVKGLQGFFPKRGAVEFIFDPVTSTFVVGNGTIKHQALATSIGADATHVVGGIFSRGPGGLILTNEASGHFWQNWTPQVRQQFLDFMDSKGLTIIHREGM